eukprot:CAMPEP_0167761546 /NCGR_PEP_ID=MMETSP0110_2-20121227/12236_1 /TAXON_ID=629695 /ORGANISM="Gymnochlora sp., Strain CCMP2014" /LENGTH=485 /DNA_ID=CAMNT_0007648249 /DNA_START=73 /DNA_END=1530 /DNA_ORIENTATION=-
MASRFPKLIIKTSLKRSFSSSMAGPATRALVAERACARLKSLYDRFGSADYIGEPLSITEHSIQAALAARKAGESDEVAVGALLHDVGHLLGLEAGFEPAMDGCGTVDHEGIGHDFLLALGFPETVAFLTKHHVSAKRYLCLRETGYLEKLSEASKITLKHQGGIMSEEEAGTLEKDGRWDAVLRFRTYDEAAKEEGKMIPSIDFFLPTLYNMILRNSSISSHISPFAGTYVLSPEQLRRWDEDGMLWIKNALSESEIANLVQMSTEVGDLPPQKGPWLIHHEAVESKIEAKEEKRLCRVENFCKHHEDWGNLAFGLVQDTVSQVEGEQAVLFKDKLNYKGPGGGGFLIHQDATAYATEDLASRHVSVMVAIDAATKENGCLEVAAGRHKEGIFDHEKGVMTSQIEDSMKFTDILVEPGDVVLFDSYLPHRSQGNKTDGWRRLAYLTYNKLSEGNLHDDYYAKKAQVMQQGAISINLDFGGKIVD